jgi:hypothetical protein
MWLNENIACLEVCLSVVQSSDSLIAIVFSIAVCEYQILYI